MCVCVCGGGGVGGWGGVYLFGYIPLGAKRDVFAAIRGEADEVPQDQEPENAGNDKLPTSPQPPPALSS